MKILIINNGPLPLPCVKGGGVESLIQMFIENTTMQDITIISVYDAEAEEISRKYKNITFEYVNFNRKKDLLLRGFYYFLNKIALRPIGNAYIHKVVKKVNVSNYDLIISENGVGFGYYLKCKTKAKLILHLHNDWLHQGDKFSEKYKNAYDEIWTISKFIKDRVDGIKGEVRTKVLYNGTDLTLFNRDLVEKRTDEYKRKYQIDKNTYVIAACSRIVEEKGVIQLQNAFKKMKEKYKIKNTKLLIIGSILPKTDYINQVLNNVDDDMLFTDYVSHSEMPAILAMADIVVTPTVHLLKKYKGKDYIGVQEGLNLTIIEALSLGIPVVASNSGGMVEILDNQKIGCVISAREDLMVVELPDVLYHYYLNPADTNVKQACILAAQKYSQEKYVQTYERYINKVLNG